MKKDLIVKQIDNELINSDILKENNKELVISKKSYNNLQRMNNEINEELTLEVNDHKETCVVHGEKDIKQCSISFNNNCISKQTIDKAIDYAFNTLLMNNIFVEVNQDDINIIKQLNKMNFEDLGLVNGKLTFLKEREEKEIGSVLDGYNKKH